MNLETTLGLIFLAMCLIALSVGLFQHLKQSHKLDDIARAILDLICLLFTVSRYTFLESMVEKLTEQNKIIAEKATSLNEKLNVSRSNYLELEKEFRAAMRITEEARRLRDEARATLNATVANIQQAEKYRLNEIHEVINRLKAEHAADLAEMRRRHDQLVLMTRYEKRPYGKD